MTDFKKIFWMGKLIKDPIIFYDYDLIPIHNKVSYNDERAISSLSFRFIVKSNIVDVSVLDKHAKIMAKYFKKDMILLINGSLRFFSTWKDTKTGTEKTTIIIDESDFRFRVSEWEDAYGNKIPNYEVTLNKCRCIGDIENMNENEL